MITKIATGVVAVAAMFAAFAGTAQAEVPEDGLYTFTNRTEAGVVAFEGRLEKVGMTDGGEGIFLIHTGEADNKGFLSAESSEDGANVDYVGPNETHWILHKNSNGWSLHHKDNGANCLSTKRIYILRRANAGGRGNKDQLFEMKKTD